MELIKSSGLIIVMAGKREERVEAISGASKVNDVLICNPHYSIATEYAFHNIGQDQFDSFSCGVL